MAEAIGIIASAITVAGTAAQLSLALFKVAQTFKHAPREISEIALEISSLSNSLNVLVDTLQAFQHLCTPKLFEEMHSILQRFKQIEDQLVDLTSDRGGKTLSRLKWFFDGPKAKSLLKKVESVKSALTLMLVIMNVSAEQVSIQLITSNGDQASHQPPPPQRPNKYRKVLESVVEANRLAVDRAQEEEEHQPTEKRRRLNTELHRYEADSHDTATWLYHLVFSPEPPPKPFINKKQLGPTVEEYDSDAAETSAVAIESASSSHSDETYDKTIIVWNNNTEPSIVADKLLDSWTTLDKTQIQASRASYSTVREIQWREGLMKRIQEYYDSSTKTNPASPSSRTMPRSEDTTNKYRKYDTDDAESTDEDYQSAEESTVTGDTERPPEKAAPVKRTRFEQSYTTNSSEDEARMKPPQRPPSSSTYSQSRSSRQANSRVRRNVSPDSWRYSHEESAANYNPFAASAASGYSAYPYRYPPSSGFSTQYGYTSSPPNAYYQNSTRAGSPAPPPRAYPQPPPAPPPPPPAEHPVKPSHNEILAKIEALLENARLLDRSKSDMKFAALEERLISSIDLAGMAGRNEDCHGQEETPKADDDSSRLDRFEEILVEFGELQRKRHEDSEAAWKAEKAKSDAIAAHNAAEARQTAQQELELANAAKKAAEQALEIAKQQAAERARKEAELKAAEEKQKKDAEYDKRIERYEEQLASFTKKWEQLSEQPRDRTNTGTPLRRTRIAEGQRQIEISEFTKDGLEPLVMSRLPSGMLIEEELVDVSSSASRDVWGMNRRTSSKYPAAQELPGLVTHRSDQAASSKLIQLPSHMNRSSAKTSEIQTSLDRSGIMTVFDGIEGSGKALVSPGETKQAIVRSSVFWEPPLLSLGSELLSTLRWRGWKPFYARKSDSGQTYFFGHEPVHVDFFRPGYCPQFKESAQYASDQCVLISKEMIEERAIEDLGFDYTLCDHGVYALDCRLTANDIEALIERSFMTRETNFRKQHRQLQWSTSPSPATPTADLPRHYEPSVVSESTGTSSVGEETNYPASDFADDEGTIDNSPVEDMHATDSGFVSMEKDIDDTEKDWKWSTEDVPSTATSTALKGIGPLRLRLTGRMKVHAD